MAVIGIDKLHQLVKEIYLVENLGKRELENPEGCGFDLRLGVVNKIVEGGAFIEADGEAGLGLRKGVKTEEILRFKENSESPEFLVIKPGDYYLVQTIESVNLPSNLMVMIFPRSSLFRAGLQLLVTKGDPGYRGALTFGLTNIGAHEVKLQLGARICNVVFMEVEGGAVEYRGQAQGGRVSPEEAERQV